MSELRQAVAEYLKSAGFEIIREEPECLIVSKLGRDIWHYGHSSVVIKDAIYICGGNIRMNIRNPNSLPETAAILNLCYLADNRCGNCAMPNLIHWYKKVNGYDPAATITK
jgi:hypothetical protein